MELLKIHANGQWELVEKARPMSPEEMAAFRAKRDAHLRAKHGMKPHDEHEKELATRAASRDVPREHKPDYSRRAQEQYSERVANKPKIEREAYTHPGTDIPRAPKPHEHAAGKLVVPSGSHVADVKPHVRQGSMPAPHPGGQREVIRRPRKPEE